MHVMCVPHTLCTCTPVCLGGTTAVDDIFEVIIFSRSLVLALVSGFSRTPVGVRVVIGIVLRIAHWCWTKLPIPSVGPPLHQTTLLMSTSVFHPTHDCLVSFWWKGNWLWIAVANDQCVKQFGSSRRRTVFPNPHVKFKLPLVFKMHRNSPCCTSNTGDNAHVCTAVIA